MTRHPSTLSQKSKSHQVTRLGEDAYQVISGASGKAYFVTLLDNGGATCTCDWSAKRHNVLNCGCSHTIAVFAEIEASKARKIAVHADPDQARKQHRHLLQIGDGLILSTRKAG